MTAEYERHYDVTNDTVDVHVESLYQFASSSAERSPTCTRASLPLRYRATRSGTKWFSASYMHTQVQTATNPI